MTTQGDKPHVILGASAAGLAAAAALRGVDSTAVIVVISDEDCEPYLRCLISYGLAGSIDKGLLPFRPDDFLASRRIETVFGRRAVEVLPEDKAVRLDDGLSIGFRTLLIATGAAPVIPELPGRNLDGVFGFRTICDMEALLARAPKAKRAVVSGGGSLGLQVACGLHARGVEATITVRSPHLLSQAADQETGEIFRRRLEARGVRVVTGADIEAVLGESAVTGVKLGSGEVASADLVVFGKGVRPNIALVKGTTIRTNWGVVVDERLMTSCPDVYAAGDVAETTDIVTGEPTVNAIWPCATEQGRIAGLNMAGMDRRYEGSIRMNAAEFFGLPFITAGIVNPRGEDFEVVTEGDHQRDIYKKAVIRDRRLIGYILVGDIEKAGLYTTLVRKGVDITPVKGSLFSPSFGLSKLLPIIQAEPEKFAETAFREIGRLCAMDKPL